MCPSAPHRFCGRLRDSRISWSGSGRDTRRVLGPWRASPWEWLWDGSRALSALGSSQKHGTGVWTPQF